MDASVDDQEADIAPVSKHKRTNLCDECHWQGPMMRRTRISWLTMPKPQVYDPEASFEVHKERIRAEKKEHNTSQKHEETETQSTTYQYRQASRPCTCTKRTSRLTCTESRRASISTQHKSRKTLTLSFLRGMHVCGSVVHHARCGSVTFIIS